MDESPQEDSRRVGDGLPEGHDGSPEDRLLRRIDRTRGEVRRVEFFSTLTALLTLSGGFLLVGIVLDHLFRDGLPVRWRWIYALSAAAVLLAYFLKRLIVSATRRVNPLYAADVLEKNLPEVKNGLINWLTLRSRPARGGVERAIRHALASQTADHLAALPGESVVDHAPVIRWAAALAVVAALVSLYFVSAPKSPFVSAARILLPSLDWAAPQAIEFLEIEPGNGSVYYRTPVAFRARVAGGTPGDVRLIWSSADRRLVDQVVPMQSVGGQLYELTFPPEGTGMTESILYRIAAGAGRYESFSETFRLEVRPPLTFDVEKLELTPPPYTGAGTVTQEANGTIRALPETEVTITGRASEPLSKAFWVPDFSTSRAAVMTIDSDDPHRASYHFRLKAKPGKASDTALVPEARSYQLLASDAEGVRSIDDPQDPQNGLPIWGIELLDDLAPTIDWADDLPRESRLPLNARCPVSVKAADPDYGIRRVTLFIERRQAQGEEHLEESISPIELIDPVIPAGPVPNSKEVTLTAAIAPLALGLGTDDIGQEFEYYAVAEDTLLPEPNRAQTAKRSFTLQASDLNLPDNPAEEEKSDEQGESDGQGEQGREGTSDGQGQEGQEGQEAEGQGQRQDGQQQDAQGQEGEGQRQDSNQPGPQEGGQDDQSGEGGREGDQNPGEDPSGGEQQSAGQQQDENSGGASQGEGQEQTSEGQGESSSDNTDPNARHGDGGEGASDGDNTEGENTDGGDTGNDADDNDADDSDTDNNDTESGAGGNSGNNSSAGAGEGDGDGDESPQSEPIDPITDAAEAFDKILDHLQRTEGVSPDADLPTNDSSNYHEEPVDDPDSLPNSDSQAPDDAPRQHGSGTPPAGAPRERGDVDPSGNNYMATEGQAGEGTVPDDAQVTLDPDLNPSGTPASEDERRGALDSQSTNPNASSEGAVPDPAGKKDPPSGQSSDQNKSADDGAPQPNVGDGGEGDAGDRNDTPGDNSEGDSSGESTPGRQGKTSDRPNDSPSAERGHQGAGGAMAGDLEDGTAAGRADAVHLAYSEKATTLALEHLEDQLQNGVDPELLKELGWSKEELKEFLRRWQAMKAAAETLPADSPERRQYDEQLRDMGLWEERDPLRQKAAGDENRRASEVNTGRRVEPPAYYADRFRAYTEGLSRSKKAAPPKGR